MDIQDCTYSSVKKRGVGSTLPTGQACIPCRLGKNRCDAKRPCASCVSKGRGAACAYKESRPNNNSPSEREPPSSPPRTTLLARSIPSEPAFSRPPSPDSGRPPPTPPVLGYDQVLRASPSGTTIGEKALGTTDPLPRPTTSSSTVPPPIHSQSVPRPLQTSLSPVRPQRTQVSEISVGDLDMTFRLRALCRLYMLGLYLTKEKQQAILRGDTSGAVVHRHFVFGLQVIGVHVCGVPVETPVLVRLQTRYLQTAWESLVELKNTNQQRTTVQALVLLVHALIIIGLTTKTREHLLKIYEIIENGKLRFLPEYGRLGELSEQVREDISVLSQAIYLENFLYLVLGGPAPVETARIEWEFRLDLQRAYPHLFDICPLTMRTQSILLVRDVTSILNSSSDPADYTSGRRESCHHLVHVLDKFSSDLMGHLQRFLTLGDTGGAGTIWTCCVTCLAHLVALCHHISRIDPSSVGSMSRLYGSALKKLGSLSLEIQIEEYSHFDALTVKALKMVLDIIDGRTDLNFDPENGSPEDSRRAIETAYTNIRNHLPLPSPSSFTSSVLAATSRSEC